MTPLKTASVISGFATETSTRIQSGTLIFVNRNAFAWRDASPVLVPSAKKSHSNNPTMSCSLYAGSGNMKENTDMSTTKIAAGLSSAQAKPLNVPWYRALKSVRTSVHASPAQRHSRACGLRHALPGRTIRE